MIAPQADELPMERTTALRIEQSVRRFLKIPVGRISKTPEVLAALAAKRNRAMEQMEQNILQEALTEWHACLQKGDVSRPRITGSKREWGRIGMEFRTALHKFKSEFDRT